MQDFKGKAKAAASPVSRPPPAMEKKESLVIVNLIFSHAELRRIHCRYSLEDYNRNVKWHNNKFHLPYDLSKEIRDNVFLSSNRGNQSQIRKTKNNRGPA